MISSVLYTLCAVSQFYLGATTGGWGTDLGSLHYWFGIYIASDALVSLGRAVSE